MAAGRTDPWPFVLDNDAPFVMTDGGAAWIDESNDAGGDIEAPADVAVPALLCLLLAICRIRAAAVVPRLGMLIARSTPGVRTVREPFGRNLMVPARREDGARSRFDPRGAGA